MDPLVAILTLVLLTATMATMFSVVRKKGEGGLQAIAGIALGWVLFVIPLYFFGPTGAVIGVVFIMLVGWMVHTIGDRYSRAAGEKQWSDRDAG